MLLAPRDAEHFFKLHRSLMCFVNLRLQIVPGIKDPLQFAGLPPETRVSIRDSFLNQPQLLDSFLDENPYELDCDDLEIVGSWRNKVAGKFFVWRHLAKYTVFLATEQPPRAFGVFALTERIEDMIGSHVPVWTETHLLPFKGKIVYDGLLRSFNISFGSGFRRSLRESYQEAKEKFGIITSLPWEPQSIADQKPKNRPRPLPRSLPAGNDVIAVISRIVDQFCRTHLNDEYAVLCGKLAQKLARKRPSPLLRGSPAAWASGIVRSIGWVNYLDDRHQTPHMRLSDIDAELGVSKSTGQARLSEIRRLLNLRRFDIDWTLPSRMEDNPLIWLLEVNGFPTDVRHCPREVQEIALKKGLIPYIPGERD